MRYLPDDNLAYPVAITLGNGRFGSGFFLNTDASQYLVTAKHVLFDQAGALLDTQGSGIAYARDLVTRVDLRFDFAQLQNDAHLKPHQSADVALVKMGDFGDVSGVRRLRTVGGVQRGQPASAGVVGLGLSACRRFAEVLVSNKVFAFGYPNSLGMAALPQLDPTRPLLRKGIVAGKNDALQTIIIDCPLYQGNSGGLVIEVFEPSLGERHFAGIGVGTSFIPFVEVFESKQYGSINSSVENSGYSVVTPIDRVLELI